MVLGIINGWSREHIRAVRDLGLDAVEFCMNHNYDSNEILAGKSDIKSACEEFCVRVGSIGRWGMQRIDDNGDVIPEALQHDKNLIDLASYLGCPVFNAGCNYTDGKSFYENCRIAIDYFGTLIEYAKGKNVKIAAYNCDWANFVYGPDVWRVVLGALPELGIKYDSSHAINRGSDFMKEIADWGERIYHFHLKGSLRVAGETYDDSPAGLDSINWPAVMALLYIKNYDGMLSIEPHSRNWFGRRGQWAIRYTIDYMRPFIMPDDFPAENDVYMP